MAKQNYNLQMVFTVPFGVGRDTLVTAVEGGIGYWLDAESAENIRVVRDDNLHVEAVTFDWLDAGPDWFDTCISVTPQGMLGAMEKIAKGEAKVRPDIRQAVHAVMLDAENYLDAEVADAIFQVAAFDEIVYG